MVEMNKHEEWPNDLDYIVELQAELANVKKENLKLRNELDVARDHLAGATGY